MSSLTDVPHPIRDRYHDKNEIWNNRGCLKAGFATVGEKVYLVDVEVKFTVQVPVAADGPNHAKEKAAKTVNHDVFANINANASLGDVLESCVGPVEVSQIEPDGYTDKFGASLAVAVEILDSPRVAVFTYADGSRRSYALSGTVADPTWRD